MHVDLPPPHLVTTTDALQQLAADVRQARRCALDTESNSLYAYYYRVCLIQITLEDRDYIIDTLQLVDLSPLAEVVADPMVEVTLHAAENDLLELNRDYGFIFGNIYDTLWAARILGWSRPSLASILDKRYGVILDKRMQRTDWGKRPLTQAQLNYARLDTHYLLALRDDQAEMLRQQNRYEEAQEIFAGLLNIRWQEKEPATMWKLPGVRDLTAPQQAVVETLFEWREHSAQRRNVPPFKVLRNEVLMALAIAQPDSESALRQIKEVPKRLPQRMVRDLLILIQEGQGRPAPTPPRNDSGGKRPSDQELVLYEKLRQWRTRTAKMRGVEPDVVLTNQVLLTLALMAPADMVDIANSQLLGPWRLRTYGPDILRICTE